MTIALIDQYVEITSVLEILYRTAARGELHGSVIIEYSYV